MIFRNGQYDLLLFRFFFPLPSSTFKRSQLHNYTHTNTSTQMQTHKYKYTNTNTKMQTHKCKHREKHKQNSVIQLVVNFNRSTRCRTMGAIASDRYKRTLALMSKTSQLPKIHSNTLFILIYSVCFLQNGRHCS